MACDDRVPKKSVGQIPRYGGPGMQTSKEHESATLQCEPTIMSADSRDGFACPARRPVCGYAAVTHPQRG